MAKPSPEPVETEVSDLPVRTPHGIGFGRYELIQCIATGGMGEVFLARQAGIEGFQKLLVIKVLLPHLVRDAEFIRMFLDEARIAAQLNHANVAQIFDLGENQGAYYIAMEYVHGENLAHIASAARKAHRRIPLPLAARMVADAAAGLDYAHKVVGADNQPLKIVHRDVSPQNILVTFDGAVKVIDFGIAKAAGRTSNTQTGALKGKCAYMSPEQAGGKPIDRRSDIFSLGVVFFELATGKRLFKRDNDLQTLMSVVRCEVPQPSAVEPKIDPLLEALMLKALARDPAERFQEAGAFRLALEEWLVNRKEAASSAHLGAFIQELFQVRLEVERRSGQPFSREEELASAIFKLGLTPSKPTGLVAPKTAAPRRPARLAVVAAALIALLAGIVWFAASHGWTGPAGVTVITNPPGALVKVDGSPVAHTPCMDVPLPANGVAEVEISKPGFVSIRRKLDGAGKHRLELALQEEPPTAPPAARPASLVVHTTPSEARVAVNGKKVGVTPIDGLPLPSEVSTVEISKHGYAKITRQVRGEGKLTLDLTLEAVPPIDPKVLKAFESAKADFQKGKFAAAEKKFARASDFMVDDAAEWLDKAQAELGNERNLKDADARLRASDLAGARHSLDLVPEASYFGPRVKALRAQLVVAEKRKPKAAGQSKQVTSDGQVFDQTGAYHFRVEPMPGAESYLWGFFQNGTAVWENWHDEQVLSGTEYSMPVGSVAHGKLAPGSVDIWVRGSIKGQWTEARIIKIQIR